ncbi:MAG TPA: endo-1,4-beta-xylanase [Gemmataceae bacterium]|jgi:hypothetical protein|nr:endo-1,4-beta-xylanase [Gemmataceae bacterium]
MGEMIFMLPTGIDAASRHGLERACLAGGPESVPWPTLAVVENDRLVLTREIGESGSLHAPWRVDGSGRFMLSSCTLMERAAPYRLLVELTRGKLNQVRNQSWEWRAAGLEVPNDFGNNLRRAQQSFRTAVAASSPEVADLAAGDALESLSLSGRSLVQAYVEQVFHLRRDRTEPPTFELGCRYQTRPPAKAEPALATLGKTATLMFSWKDIEPVPGTFSWEKADELAVWAEESELHLTGGPLIDLGAAGLPDWIEPGLRDVNQLAKAMCRFTQAVVRRYQPLIRRWILTRASNCSSSVQITEHAMLWLNLRLAQTVRQVVPDAELVVAIARPWGDYLAVEDREHSPFVFADTLLRSEINLTALEVELIMGLPGRESYLRDLLDTSRLLDYYSLLGAPLRVTLAYPSRVPADSKDETVASEGSWQEGATPAGQADWGDSFAALALCKPYVQDVTWICAMDNPTHPLAGCGLCDELGHPKPIVQELGSLERHFKG